MLQQILIHTPTYVWAILAVLVYRGVIASADREMAFSRMFIIPAIMLLLTLQDLSAKFGLGGLTVAAWTAGALAGAALAWLARGARVAPGATPGRVLVRGSWIPLALMMAIFLIKYATAVLLAMNSQARHDSLLVALVCALFGLLNGIFFGRLARDTQVLLRVLPSNQQIA